MKYQEMLKKVSKELDIPWDTVDKVYKAYWLYVRNHFKSLPLKTCTEEEFKKMKSSMNIPNLGKFYVDDTFFKQKEYYKKNKNAKSKED